MTAKTYHLSRIFFVLIGAALAIVSLHFSAFRFGGYDPSPLIDAGWRVLSGQVPGRDFICTFPPSLYLSAAAAFHLFGVSWHSLILAGSLFFACMTLLGLRVAGLLRKPLGYAGALLVFGIYVAAQAIPMLAVNFIWHSWMAQGLAVYAMLTTFAILRTDPLARALRVELAVHLAIAYTGLILSKPNAAFPAILVCLATLWIARLSWAYILTPLLAGLVFSSLLLTTSHTSLLSMMAGYSGVGGRLLPKPLIFGLLNHIRFFSGIESIAIYSILASALALAVSLLWKRRESLLSHADEFLALGSIATGVIAISTNYEMRVIDTPLILFGILLLSLTAAATPPLTFRLKWTGAALLCVALYFCVSRARMQMVGDWATDGCGDLVAFHDPFFGNFHNCEPFAVLLSEVDKTLADTPSQHVFFGPRLEFLYARNRIASPAHMPLWWHPGTSFPKNRAADIDRAWEQDHFDTLIFYKFFAHEITMPDAIRSRVLKEYVQVPGTTMIEVFKRRPEAQ